MNKRNSLIISILIVSLLSVIVFIGTYAYIVFVTNEGTFDANSSMLGINYVVPADLTGTLAPSTSRENGLMTSATASLKNNSETALFNMYITPRALSDNLKVSAFKWEAEGIRGGSVVCSGNGNFTGVTVDERIAIIEGCQLTTDVTTFNIYVWVDSSLVQSAIGGSSFAAKISADSVPITGEF